MILRIIVAMVMLFTLVLFAYIFGVAVDPVLQIALDNQAVQAQGYAEPIRIALFLGGTLTIPLLGIAVLIWMHTAGFRQDAYQRRL